MVLPLHVHPFITARCAEAAEATRDELKSYTKAKTDEILTLNNHLAKLKKQVEGLEAEARQQEARKDTALQVAAHRTLEYGQVGTLGVQSHKLGGGGEGHPALQLWVCFCRCLKAKRVMQQDLYPHHGRGPSDEEVAGPPIFSSLGTKGNQT
jgi:hypothetical protein